MIKVARMLQWIYSKFITVSCIPKAMLWYYLYTCNWNYLWKWIYPCITWYVKAIHIWIIYQKGNRFRGKNPEHNMTNHMFTPNSRCWKEKEGEKRKRPSHWSYQLIFSPHKPIYIYFYIEVMGIMTKTCTIRAVTICTSLQPIICQFTTLHTKPWVTHTLELLIKQRRVNTTHPRKGWNRKIIYHWSYQVFTLKNKKHWRLMKYFILKNHWETRTWSNGMDTVSHSLQWEKGW